MLSQDFLFREFLNGWKQLIIEKNLRTERKVRARFLEKFS